jgi:hypothetical protein
MPGKPTATGETMAYGRDQLRALGAAAGLLALEKNLRIANMARSRSLNATS